MSELKELGGFELIAKLGAGAMGSVFKARQKSLDRIVALKVLPPSVAKDQTFIERFLREARTSAKLNHQHIVQGIDVGQDPATGLYYFAMEYVDGPTLRTVLKQQCKLPEQQVLQIARQMALALQCAQRSGIVHRDIKPDNILLTSAGDAKLADLGLAKQTNADDATLTMGGQALGTPYYMSPEQVRGEVNQLTVRTDIYSLGATLFHLITGQPPFNGPTSAVIMAKHLQEAPPGVRELNSSASDGCSRLIAQMLQKDPRKRPQDADELLTEIDRVQRGETAPTPALRARTGRQAAVRGRTTGPRGPITEPPAAAVSAPQPDQRPPLRLLIGGASAIVALVLVVLVVFGGSTPPPAPNLAPVAATPAPIAPSNQAVPAPSSPPPIVEQPNKAVTLAAAALEKALKDGPSDAFALVLRLTAIENSVSGTPSEQAWAAALKRALGDAEQMLAKPEQYAEVLSFKRHCVQPPLSALFERALKAAESKALETWQAARANAEQKMQAADFAAASGLVRPFSAHPAPVVAEAATKELERIAAAETANAARELHLAKEAQAQGPRAQYELYEALLKTTENYDLAAARQVLNAFRAKPAAKGLAAEMTKISTDLDWLQAQGAKACAELAEQKTLIEVAFGRTSEKAKVIRATSEGVLVTISGGPEMPVAVGKIAPLEVVNVRKWNQSGKEAALDGARFLFWRNQLPLARKRLSSPPRDDAEKELLERIEFVLNGSDRFHKPQSPKNLVAAVPRESKGPDGKALLGLKDVPVDLTWESGSLNTRRYRLERKIGANTFQPLAEVERDAAKFRDEKLPLQTAVAYRLVALNTAGESPPSVEAALVTPSPKILNLISNGDFEEGSFKDWHVPHVARDQIVYSAEGAHSGKGAARIHGHGVADLVLKLEAGKTYEVSGWLKILSQEGADWGGVACIVQNMAWQTVGKTRFHIIDGAATSEKQKVQPGEWAQFKFSFTAAEREARLLFGKFGGEKIMFEAMFDDLVVREAP